MGPTRNGTDDYAHKLRVAVLLVKLDLIQFHSSMQATS